MKSITISLLTLFCSSALLNGLHAQTPALYCAGQPGSLANFAVTETGNTQNCSASCTVLQLQGNTISESCATQRWYLDGLLFAAPAGSTNIFCYDFQAPGTHWIRHEVYRMVNDTPRVDWAECPLVLNPCCNFELQFSITATAVDSVNRVADFALTDDSQNIPAGATYLLESGNGIVYQGNTLPLSLENVAFGNRFDRLCLTIRSESGCEKKRCIFLDSLPAADRHASPGVEGAFSCTVFPNPADKLLQVYLPDAEDLPVELAMYNEMGTLVMALQLLTAQTAVDVSHLPAGFYLIRMRSAKQMAFSQKIFVGRG